MKILTVSTRIDFPHAAHALQIRRRHHLDQPRRFTTDTVYAITNLHVHEAGPAQLPAWIRRHRHIENQIHRVRDVTYNEDRSTSHRHRTPRHGRPTQRRHRRTPRRRYHQHRRRQSHPHP